MFGIGYLVKSKKKNCWQEGIKIDDVNNVNG